MNPALRAGFTLIEMVIVLVIIGLIVGAVLVGQNLINAAAVRAQISQIEKYNSAVNTFRGKYNNYLPGDIRDPDASSFGFIPRGNAGCLAGLEDGNGLIESETWGCHTGPYQGAGETVVFWVDLSTAGLIDQSFSAATNILTGTTLPQTAIPSYFPTAKIGQKSR
jgi:prepilin-type N-terminal cleavage/methylation domain-containing protein